MKLFLDISGHQERGKGSLDFGSQQKHVEEPGWFCSPLENSSLVFIKTLLELSKAQICKNSPEISREIKGPVVDKNNDCAPCF